MWSCLYQTYLWGREEPFISKFGPEFRYGGDFFINMTVVDDLSHQEAGPLAGNVDGNLVVCGLALKR